MKNLIFLLSFITLSADACPDHSFKKLDPEKEACLKTQLGEPGNGERPSKEKMEAAFNACGIEKPSQSPKEALRIIKAESRQST